MVADSPTKNAGPIGVGHGTVTSLNDQPGTGLVWTSDVQGGNLRIYKAIPENGLLVQLKSFNINSVTKFNRPVFGDGRVYMGTTNGYLHGFGSPVNLPLNCTSPVNFGISELATATAPLTITCTAKVTVRVDSITLPETAHFNITELPTTPLQLTSTGSFTFQAYFKPGLVGSLSSDVSIATSGATGFSIATSVTLRGNGESSLALLQVSPRQLSFGAVTGESPNGVDQSALIINAGNSPLVITGLAFGPSDSGPFTPITDLTGNPKSSAFVFSNLPQTIAPQSTSTINVNFDTSKSGSFTTFLQITSNGGTKQLGVVGVAGDPPVALIEFEAKDGSGWQKYVPGESFSFGNVTENTTKNLRLRITNAGGENNAALTLLVSKPPFGVSGIIGAANQVDLVEGIRLVPGESQTATLYCTVPKSQWNVDPVPGYAEWILNFNDPTFTKTVLQFDCLGVSGQSAPYQSNGSGQGRYRYLGCYVANGGQLPTRHYSSGENTIAKCTDACDKAGSLFCATQYERECWGGGNIPVQKAEEINCNYACTGDLLQSCGGNGEGAGAGKSYLSLFADIDRYNSNGTTPQPPSSTATSVPIPTGGPIVNPGVGGYASIGCYTEATTGRALPNGFTMPAGNKNVATCIAGCAGRSFIYAGLEYGQECWCGNAFSAGSVPAPAADCKIACVDNKAELCGGNSRLNVYQAGSGSSSSSSVSSTTVSTSATTITISSSTSSTTSAITSTLSSSAAQTTISSSASSTGLTTLSTTTTRAPSSSSTTSASASASPSGPVVKPTVGAYTFHGCWTEIPNGRALDSKVLTNDLMTLEMCSNFCTGFAYFGAEYGRECYCGTIIKAGSALAENQNDCKFPCPGDTRYFCGAGVRIQMYKLTFLISTSASTVSSTTVSISSSSISIVSSSTTSTTT